MVNSDYDDIKEVDIRFNERVVIITGGSQGIGEGCARVFCQEGGLVVIAALEPEDGQTDGRTLAEEMTRSSPGKAIFKKCDVTVHSEIQLYKSKYTLSKGCFR